MSEQRGEQRDNTPSKERVQKVGEVIRGLLKIVEDGGLKEVESTQPEKLKQEEAKDSNGNEITYITDSNGLASCIEIRDANDRCIAQSWDGKNWSVDRYIENGTDFTV